MSSNDEWNEGHAVPPRGSTGQSPQQRSRLTSGSTPGRDGSTANGLSPGSRGQRTSSSSSSSSGMPTVSRSLVLSKTVNDHANSEVMSTGRSSRDDDSIMSGYVRVFCRARPFTLGEMQSGSGRIIAMNGDKTILVNPRAFQADADAIAAVAAAASLEKMQTDDWAKVFRFDRSMWSVDGAESGEDAYCSQEGLYDAVGRDLVEDLVRGVPVTCFTYGHTGTGKTYSMFGEQFGELDIPSFSESGGVLPEKAGLVPRVFTDVINRVFPSDPASSNMRVTVSFTEIYQEKIRDMLSGDAAEAAHQDLKIREHPMFGPYVEGLTRVPVDTPEQMLECIKESFNRRAVGETSRNAASSRSHAIVTLEMTPRDAPVAIYSAAKYRKSSGPSSPPFEIIRARMIDLAGSEKEYAAETTSTTKFKSPKQKEEANIEKFDHKLIRKSLSTLGYIVKALAQGVSVKGMPFRDSALTWLLKDALTGQCGLAVIATVSPAGSCYEETLSTLKYADRLCALGSRGSGKHKHRGAVAINDTIDPQLTKILAAEFSRLKSELSGSSNNSARHLLKQTISDPQQRIAKLSKDSSTANKARTPGMSPFPAASPQSIVSTPAMPMTPITPLSFAPAGEQPVNAPNNNPIEPESQVQLRELYRQLHGRFVEMQIELENARTDRDSLKLEIQMLREALENERNGGSSQKPGQNKLFLMPSTDLSSALIAAEDEIAELKSIIQRKEEVSDRILNELAEERQIRATIERTAKSQVVDLISRIEHLQQQLQANEETLEKYSSDIKVLEEKKEVAAETIHTLKVEIQVSREEVIRRTTELEETIEGLNKQVEALIQERETLDPNSVAAREEKEKMLEKISKLVLRVEELNKKLDEAYRQVGRAEFDVKEALKDKADWMSKENAWIKRVQDIQAALERTESEKNTLLGREGEMVKQIMDLESALATMETSYSSKVDILTLERDSLAEIVEKQRQTLSIQKQQGEASLRMLTQRQAALDRVQSQLTDPESMQELNRLQEELSQMLTKEGETLMNEIVDAEQLLEVVAALKGKFKDIEVLSEELQFERTQRNSLESDFAELERKNEDLLQRINDLEKEKDDFADLEQKYIANSDVREELEHFKKLCAGWENRAQYWQNIAKKSMSGPSIPHPPPIDNGPSAAELEAIRSAEAANFAAEIADLKHMLGGKEEEYKSLSVKLSEALDRAQKSQDESQLTKDTMQKELASLWLAVQELNSLDAAKDKALQDAFNERNTVVSERDELIRKLNTLQMEYTELQLELEEIDKDLIRAADEEGIPIDSIETQFNPGNASKFQLPKVSMEPLFLSVDSRASTPSIDPPKPRGDDYRPVQAAPPKSGANNRPSESVISLADLETERGLERQLEELNQYLQRDKNIPNGRERPLPAPLPPPQTKSRSSATTPTAGSSNRR